MLDTLLDEGDEMLETRDGGYLQSHLLLDFLHGRGLALATLLGLVVYLRPLIPLWRPHTSDDETATADEAATDVARPSGQTTGLVIAWVLWLFVLWLGWRGLA